MESSIGNKKILFSRRAEIPVERMSHDEQEKLFSYIQKALHLGLHTPYAAKLAGYDNIYVIKAGRELRVIFEVSDDSVTILDILTRDKMSKLAGLGVRKETRG